MSNWIQTYTGKRFTPSAPLAELFDIRDVAHSLSLLCRYNGHCREFYSVAEHSVRVSHVCPEEHRLWGLLHDLGEAYMGDLPRPIKGQFPHFVELEDRLLQVAAGVFGLTWPMPPEVKVADDILLATEFRDLMAKLKDPWPLAQEPLPDRIVPMSPPEAEQAYLDRFEELTGGRTRRPSPTAT